MKPTPFPDLNAVLAELVKGQREALGDDLLGVYLQGSFALGDADENSDVDFVAILHGELNERELEGLQALHPRLYDREEAWAKHLEGSYFPAAHLRSYKNAGGKVAYLDNGARTLIFSDHCDTAVVRWTLREHGVPLFGPEPKTLVDPVPPEALRQEVEGLFKEWVGDMIDKPETIDSAWYQAFAVVMVCRMLQTLATGRVHSKKAGVEWALATLDPRWQPLIRKAWSQRPHTWSIVHQPPDRAELLETVEFIRATRPEH